MLWHSLQDARLPTAQRRRKNAGDVCPSKQRYGHRIPATALRGRSAHINNGHDPHTTAPTQKKVVAFLHPYAAQGGGGESACCG